MISFKPCCHPRVDRHQLLTQLQRYLIDDGLAAAHEHQPLRGEMFPGTVVRVQEIDVDAVAIPDKVLGGLVAY